MARTITVKLPDSLAARLSGAVRRRSRTQSELIREALELHLDANAHRGGSCADLAGDLAGSVSGPADLSSNRRRLRGYGGS